MATPHNGPNEQAEAEASAPDRAHLNSSLTPAGADATRGLGVSRTTRALTDLVFNTQTDRAPLPTWGSMGPATVPATRFARLGGKWKDDFPNAKVLVANLKPGDAHRISSGGGGGYGPAFERPAQAVCEDVRQGYVSVEAAAELYGVVVDPETFKIDQSATNRLRSAAV